jgi:hypothetical protein
MNERFAGASAGTAFGDGSYFADDAGKIDQYVRVDQQYDGTSSLHKRLYSTSHSHPGHVFYALVFRVMLGHSVHYADKREASFNPNTLRRELCSIPSTDPPTSYHSLIAEGSRSTCATTNMWSFTGCPPLPLMMMMILVIFLSNNQVFSFVKL